MRQAAEIADINCSDNLPSRVVDGQCAAAALVAHAAGSAIHDRAAFDGARSLHRLAEHAARHREPAGRDSGAVSIRHDRIGTTVARSTDRVDDRTEHSSE
jgi:hypothetical protein